MISLLAKEKNVENIAVPYTLLKVNIYVGPVCIYFLFG